MIILENKKIIIKHDNVNKYIGTKENLDPIQINETEAKFVKENLVITDVEANVIRLSISACLQTISVNKQQEQIERFQNSTFYMFLKT